jgi:hypothetical protein
MRNARFPIDLTVLPGIGAVLTLVMFAWATTPRGRTNVMLVAMTAFSLAVLWRSRPEGPKPRSGLSLSLVLIAPAAALLAWGGTVFHYFVSDEFIHLYQVRQPLWDLLWTTAVEGESGAFLRPVGFFTYWLDSRLWGSWMPGYHVTQLALHLGTVAGVFALARATDRLRHLAVPAALVFAVLPVNAEAVAWVGARFDLVSGLLVVWSIACYLAFRHGRGRWLYGAALLLAMLAFFAKENAYVLPLLVLTAELALTPSRRLGYLWGFGALYAGGAIYRMAVLGNGLGYLDASGRPQVMDMGFKTLEGLLVRVPSLSLLGVNWLEPGPGLAVAIGLAAVLLTRAVGARPDRRAVVFAFAWMVLSAVPAHSLALIGPGLTNSRVLYLGAAGAALAVAAVVGPLETHGRLLGITLTAALMLLGAWHNLGAWNHASDLSERLLGAVTGELPAPPPDTDFVFSGVPETVRGVYFLRVSMTQPLWVAYGREDLRGYRQEQLTETPPGAVHFEWLGEGARLIERR